jgi:hypothetical protein
MLDVFHDLQRRRGLPASTFQFAIDDIVWDTGVMAGSCFLLAGVLFRPTATVSCAAPLKS